MTDERRYSEAERRALFERAAKRQEAARRAEAASGDQLTLAELQEIGAASGIDPAHIAAAASELAAAPPVEAHTFLGAPTEAERARLLPGPVSDEAWARMVAEVRRTFGDDGSIGQIGRMREWTVTKRGAGRRSESSIRLALEPAGGGTRATLRQSVRETARDFGIAAAINAAMAVVFALLAAFGPEPGLWIPAVMLASMALVFAGGMRGWLGYWGGKQRETFGGVLDRLELIARSDHTEQPTTEQTAVAASDGARIDLDDLPDPEEETGAAQRNRTRS